MADQTNPATPKAKGNTLLQRLYLAEEQRTVTDGILLSRLCSLLDPADENQPCDLNTFQLRNWIQEWTKGGSEDMQPLLQELKSTLETQLHA